MSDPASSTYSKQSRLAARSNMQLGLIVAAVALLCFVFKVRYYEHFVKPLLWLAAFFFFVGLLEFAAMKWKKNRDESPSPSKRGEHQDETKEAFVPNDEFTLTTSGHRPAYERRFLLDGRPVTVRVPAKFFPKAKSNANALATNLDELSRKFREFRSTSADSNSQFSQEIRKLELDSILFVAANQAEVYFTYESGGDAWGAVWDADKQSFEAMSMTT
jgi:hypothetical protein